jgi:hypothetical protein
MQAADGCIAASLPRALQPPQRSRIAPLASSTMLRLSDVFRNIVIIVIAAEEIARRIVEQSQPLLPDYAGIALISDTEVLRNTGRRRTLS